MGSVIHVGIDEVGRGCWAGPLLAAAVVLAPSKPHIAGLNDSKKLSRSRRESLDVLIRAEALAYGVGWVWPEAIDSGGITAAVKSAMQQAATEVLDKLAALGYTSSEIEVVIDGSYNFLPLFKRQYPGITVRTLVGADGLVPAVSAASIIAKVARDKYMTDVAHGLFPAYGFDAHVGYGTAAHSTALATTGVTPIHRMSYKPIKKFLTDGPGLLQSMS